MVLISDLADDPNDFQRLDTVLNEYQVEGIRLRVIALNADPNDTERFKGLIGKASSIIPAGLSGTRPGAIRAPHTAFPFALIGSAAAVTSRPALHEVRSARLTWGVRRQEAPS